MHSSRMGRYDTCRQTCSGNRRIRLVPNSLLLLHLLCARVQGYALPAVTGASFDSEIVDIQWVGPAQETVLLYTRQGRLHRSGDGGKTWGDITEKVPALISVVKVITSPALKSSTAVAIGLALTMYATDDAGLTWHLMKHPAAGRLTFIFHPSRPTWALISLWTHDCRLKTPGAPCTHQLMVTKDLARTDATFVSKHIVQFSWGRGAQQDRIYYTHFRDKSGKQQMLARWMNSVDLVSTDDFGATTTVQVKHGNKFIVSDGFILVAKPKDEQAQTVNLMVSSDGGETFAKATFPNQLDEKSYAILDASEGFVVLHVNHGKGLGNIYVSDGTGSRYTKSLENVVGIRGMSAFEKVSNLQGIYFANIWDLADHAGFLAAPSPHGKWLDEGDFGLQDMSTQTQSERSIRSLKARSEQPWQKQVLRRLKATGNVRSVMSFDAGGMWTHLSPPRVDSRGQKIDCPPERCWLHIHDTTYLEQFVPFYSYDKARGIIMGTGNVGPHLSYNRSLTNTYLSRDGGRTWSEVHKGVYIYEFGNHGGVLTMAGMAEPTRYLIFSLDEGKTWNEVEFSDEAMNVTNILIEPAAVSTQFVAYGSRGGKGVLYHLDFDKLGWKTCALPNSPGTDGSDYETWVPRDHKTMTLSGTVLKSKKGCLLGHQVSYTRRKQNAKCFTGVKKQLPVQYKTCECTPADFECEVDFYRPVGNGECAPNGDLAGQFADAARLFPEEYSEQCINGAKSFLVDRYRRVPGDVCEGGWAPKLAQFSIDCPSPEPESSGLVPRLLLICGLSLAGAWLWRSGRVQDWLEQLGYGSSYGSVRKVTIAEQPGSELGSPPSGWTPPVVPGASVVSF